MPNCSAKNCKSKHFKGTPITFHKFPKDPARRSEWVKNLGRENFVPRNHSKVCSKHFEADCFDREKFGGTWLKSTAVPTIFDSNTAEDYAAIKKEPPPIPDTSMDEVSDDDASDFEKELSADRPKKKSRTPSKNAKTKRKRFSYLGDFKEGVNYTSEELRIGLQIANKLVKQQNRKIRCLKGINSRLKRRVEVLNDTLEEYKKKVYIPSEVLKAALARNKKIVKQNMNGSTPKTNESCNIPLPAPLSFVTLIPVKPAVEDSPTETKES